MERLLAELGFEVVRVGQDWSAEEVEAVVHDYFDMLRLESKGILYSKADHNEKLRQRLRARSKGSVEMKHQNISAALDQLGLPYIAGYKPRANYQERLRQEVMNYVERRHHELAAVVDAIEEMTAPGDRLYRGVLVDVPTIESGAQPAKRQRLPRRLDYAARDERNRALGHNGEAWVVGFERTRLAEVQCAHLIDKIDWVSNRLGDGAGYDILSFEPDGIARFIEVKTTNGGSLTPFVVSRNEVDFSEETEDAFCLYRVFAFSRKPQLFILRGALSTTAQLEPLDYRARLKAISR
ncbi:protein NO VEIN domain-containing protein [Thauera sinica]|uniref:DUF3883 domain-containing protein n=1 Tax=Thauera sinica TaxID=2665146 RepID=A0ABW1AXE5_9RHOO|nr:DUF3883 domain-containing protein [Thauera sp. K11]